MEIKKIENYDKYFICDNGDVISEKAKTKKILSKNKTNGNGYIVCSLLKNGKYKNHYVHRMVAKAFIPNPENKPTVNHIDGNKKNNNVDNLEWNTYSENSTHAINVLGNIRNTKPMREAAYLSIIKEITLTNGEEIITAKSGTEMAKKLGVSVSGVSMVRRGINKTIKGYELYNKNK